MVNRSRLSKELYPFESHWLELDARPGGIAGGDLSGDSADASPDAGLADVPEAGTADGAPGGVPGDGPGAAEEGTDEGASEDAPGKVPGATGAGTDEGASEDAPGDVPGATEDDVGRGTDEGADGGADGGADNGVESDAAGAGPGGEEDPGDGDDHDAGPADPSPGQASGPGSDRGPTIRYHYLDEGPRDAPAILMLHGNPTWSFYYRTLIPALSQQYRVIVPDHVGCGLSDKPQRYPYTLEQHARNVEALVDHLELRDLTLVVHDWGGAIGMRYATRHADHVARLVIFNSAAFYVQGSFGAALPLRIKICRLPVLGDLLVRGLNAFAGLALAWAPAHPERLTPEVRAGYLAPYDSWRNRVAILRFVRDIPLEASHPTRPVLAEIEAELPRLARHPTLIIWGEQDFCFTAKDFLPEWRRRFPNNVTHLVADAGHYVVEDAHTRIARWILAFLEREVAKAQPGLEG